MLKIIAFEEKYRDDMIFCLLSAKDALGGAPRLNEDLLDVGASYLACGGMFWLALSGRGRVIGMLGLKRSPDGEWWLKRFYVKPELKRRGIGGALLKYAERYAKENGAGAIHTRFGDSYAEAAWFYSAKGFVDAGLSDGKRHMTKKL